MKWRLLLALSLLAACKATPAELAAVRCDPGVDREECGDDGMHRLVCNPANGQWTPVEVCSAPLACVESPPNLKGQRTAECAQPDLNDSSGGGTTADVDADAAGKPDGDTAVGALDGGADAGDAVDGVAVNDAKDTVADGATDGGAETTAVGTLPKQSCFAQFCPSQTAVCQKSPGCIAAIGKALACVSQCGGGQGCVSQCQSTWSGDAAAFSLAACGMLVCAGGCGDGSCSGGETPTSCPKDCKAATTGSCLGFCGKMASDCYCDPPCVKKGDCCTDFAMVCGG